MPFCQKNAMAFLLSSLWSNLVESIKYLSKKYSVVSYNFWLIIFLTKFRKKIKKKIL